MLLAAAGVVTTGILAAPQARAVTAQQIVNVGSGECLAVFSNSNGAEAVQEPCNSGFPEYWDFDPVCTQLGCNNQYEIRLNGETLCLAPSSSSVPATVVLSSCSTSLNDVWKRQPGSTSPFVITNDLDGASMHPNSNSNTSGATIYVHPVTTDTHYQWRTGLSIG